MKRFHLIGIGILTVFSLFGYFYRKSGNIRKSIRAALVAFAVLISGPSRSAAKGADAFGTKPPQHQTSRRALPAKPNNPGNPGKPDGNGDGSDGFPEYPNRESVEETQQRLENIDQYSKRMEDSSSSDSEDEQCPASRFNIYEERQNFVEEMKSKGYSVSDIDCDVERFEELSTNPETGFVDQKSLNEAKTILQSEKENLVVNARRPNLKKGEPNLDFVVDGPGPYKYVDVKNSIDPGKFPGRKTETIPKMSKRIGKKITMQKAGSDKVLHIVDLEQIPDEQKDIVVENVIDGAGSAESIDFIN